VGPQTSGRGPGENGPVENGRSKTGQSKTFRAFLEDVVERRAEHGKLRHLCRSSSHGALTYIEDGLPGS
jgi:hypothetical protein